MDRVRRIARTTAPAEPRPTSIKSLKAAAAAIAAQQKFKKIPRAAHILERQFSYYTRTYDSCGHDQARTSIGNIIISAVDWWSQVYGPQDAYYFAQMLADDLAIEMPRKRKKRTK